MIHKKLDALIAEMIDKGIILNDALTEFEKRFIKQVMNHCNNKVSKAAQILGIHRNTLSYKIKNSCSNSPSSRKRYNISRRK